MFSYKNSINLTRYHQGGEGAKNLLKKHHVIDGYPKSAVTLSRNPMISLLTVAGHFSLSTIIYHQASIVPQGLDFCVSFGSHSTASKWK